MGMLDTIRRWLTPLPAQTEERQITVPWVNFNGRLYPLNLSQTLIGEREEVGRDFEGLTTGGYAGNAIVFALMQARASLFSEARFQFRQLRSGRPGELFGNRDLALLERPWPNGTTGDLLTYMIADLDLAGNAFIVRRPGRLARLRPDWTVIVHGSNGRTGPAWDPDAEVIGYIYKPGGPAGGLEPVFYDAEEVAHFRGVTPDPLAPARGMSWLTPVVREIEADSAATNHKLAFFRNGASPSTIVTGIVPGAGQSLQDWVDAWRSKNEGVANAYKTQFYTPGVSVEVVGKDLGQIEYSKVTGAGETRLAAAAGVPPIIAGLSEGLQGSSLNAGNFDAAFRRFTDITMRPLWRNAAGSLATIIRVPGGAELWYDDRDIPALRSNVKDVAEVQVLNAQAMRQLSDGGWEPDSVVDAIVAGDWRRLTHTGKLSVQLQDPDAEPPPEPDSEPAPEGPAPAGPSDMEGE